VRSFRVMGLILAFVACATVGVALAASKPLPLSARVIQPGEFPGFVAYRPPTLFKTPQQWVGPVGKGLTRAQASAQIARLRAEGFVAVADRQLGTPTNVPWGGLSWAIQLGSATAAKAELAAEVRDTKNTAKPPASYAAFAVSGITGARGYQLVGPSGGGDNVQFADGPFVYLVAFGWTGNPKNRPTRANLIAAATRLYKRVHGHPPA
jgi:hypothetical protein